MKQWKAESILFMVTIIWGGTFLFTKVGLEFANFSLYMALRFGIALTLALILFGKNLRQMTKKVFKGGTILGICFGVGFALQTLGLKYTDVSNSAFITGLTMPMTPFIAYFIFRKSLRKTAVAGVIIAFIGMSIFTNPFAGSFNRGDMLTFLSAFCWAFYITYMDIFTKDARPGDSSLYLILQLAYSLLIALLIFFVFDYRSIVFIPNQKLLFSLLYNGLLASFLVTFLHTVSQRYTTPVKAALIFSLEPICATIFAVIIFSDTLSTNKIIGGSIMLMGILASEIGPYILKRFAKKNI